jgi:acyl carrier protein
MYQGESGDMNDSYTQIKTRIARLLVEVTENEELVSNLTDSSNLIEEVGLDSIQLINFILTLEDEFGVELDFESFDFDILRDLSKLYKLIFDLAGDRLGSAAI